MDTVFQLGKPKLRWKKINFKKASLINILRWIFIPVLRYRLNIKSYQARKSIIKSITSMDDLKSITAVCRPGKLSINNKMVEIYETK